MEKFYVLEESVLNEEKYRALRKEEYKLLKEQREEEGEPLECDFEEYFEEDVDYELKAICEIDEEAFKACETLDELDCAGFNATGLNSQEEFERETMANNYSLAIENGSWSYNLNGVDYLDLQFKVLEVDEEHPGDTKIQFDFYQFI